MPGRPHGPACARSARAWSRGRSPGPPRHLRRRHGCDVHGHAGRAVPGMSPSTSSPTHRCSACSTRPRPIGALLATATSGWSSRVQHHGRAVVVAAAAYGAFVALAGLAPTVWWALAALTLAGAADMISGLFRGIVWHQTIPDDKRGRLAGIEMLSYSIGPLGGQTRAGLVADLTSVRASIVSGGILFALGWQGATTAIAGCVTSRRCGGAGPEPTSKARCRGPPVRAARDRDRSKGRPRGRWLTEWLAEVTHRVVLADGAALVPRPVFLVPLLGAFVGSHQGPLSLLTRGVRTQQVARGTLVLEVLDESGPRVEVERAHGGHPARAGAAAHEGMPCAHRQVAGQAQVATVDADIQGGRLRAGEEVGRVGGHIAGAVAARCRRHGTGHGAAACRPPHHG